MKHEVVRAVFVGAMVMAMVVGLCGSACAVVYKPIALGSAGWIDSTALDINNDGQIVGSFQTTSPYEYHGMMWNSNGTVVHNWGTNFSPQGINNKGQVVGGGNAMPRTEYGSAFLWDSTGLHDLGARTGAVSSAAFSINDSGQIVGLIGQHAGYWEGLQSNLWLDLGTLSGSTESCAYDINEDGQVVGSSMNATGDCKTHAFLWHNNTMQDLGDLPGHVRSRANAINDQGQIVGQSGEGGSGWTYSANYGYGFIWQNGVMTGLNNTPYNVSCGAYDINNSGRVVGQGFPGSYNAFVWQSGVFKALVGLPGTDGSRAYGINDLGQVVGCSPAFPYSTPTLWNPVPGVTLKGTVYSIETGLPIGQAMVTGLDSVSMLTANDGTFSADLLVGTYDITVSADGFVPLTISGMEVTDGWVMNRYIALTPVPEPTSLLALASGLLGLGGMCLRKKR